MFKRTALLCVIVCLALAPAAYGATFKNPVKAPGVDVKSIEALLNFGQLLIVETDEGGRPKLTTGGILIEAPTQQVWDVLQDYEHYHEFMPSTERVSVLRREGNTVDTKFEITFQFSVLKYNVEYTTRNTLHEPHSATWVMVEGDINDTWGGWELIELPGGSTAAFYSVYSDIRSIGYVVRKVLDSEPSFEVAVNSSTVILVLDAVKQRVESMPAKPAEDDEAEQPAEQPDTDEGS
ncbi:MAG: SRPBCC family protein [Candidatus Alcyoniella australis]|nr:SRPBCC family protein [Candidatus Alcyoniella australis]